ncbi:MAG TPA: DUF1302 domain-containing protein [Candidatus Didemnitutus sp.]|nr:DUF1302 domain-containing protein [Candidatus Didemnitutus sp.]
MNYRPTYPRCLPLQALAAALAALALPPASRAFVFEVGKVDGSFDTTLSVGGLTRLSNPDPDFYGITNTFHGVAGHQRSVNADDGDLNYEKGLASFLVKASSDLQLDYKKSFGLFLRGYVFNDFVNSQGDRYKIPLSDEADKVVSQGGEVLDAYVYFKSELGTMPATLRVGRQVLSWGESTFFPNGINSINPIDVGKLRQPGSELKEALRPLNMASASLSVSQNVTLEGFYLFDWERTRVDPPGTYFSTNDFVAKGGSKVYLGFGAIPDTAALGPVPRGTDNEPGHSGQYGVNLKWLATGLHDTEFGFYYMNYHSRLPVISAQTPTQPIDVALVQNTAVAIGTQTIAPAMAAAGFPPATIPTAMNTVLGAALTGVPASALPASLQPFYPAAVSAATAGKTTGFLTSAATARYLIEFPEDIHLFGASFNTSVANGIALQGEISYRDNQPLQIDDVELLFAALSSINPAYGPNNQLGNYSGQLNTYVRGWERHKVWTGQMTATWVGRGIFGAQQTTLLGEVGFVQADLPEKGKLRYDGPGTWTAGDINEMTNTGNASSGSEPASAFADKFSWGYSLVGRLEYNNVFHGINVTPLIVFSHDVSGNTPLPLGNFREDRMTFTAGADFTYQNAWAFELRYVNFFGAGRYNLLSDRDYVSATLKYSF